MGQTKVSAESQNLRDLSGLHLDPSRGEAQGRRAKPTQLLSPVTSAGRCSSARASCSLPGALGIAGLWRSSAVLSPPFPPCSDQARCCAQEPSSVLALTTSPGQIQHPQAAAWLKTRALVKLAMKTQDKVSQSPVSIPSSHLYWKRA